MLGALKKITSILSTDRADEEARALYIKIVEISRRVDFYTVYSVPDTVDGRFDMINIHLFLLSARLKKEGTNEALEVLRAVTEIFFSDMDRSLREMGASDTGIGKRIKKMSQAFYGRVLAYQAAGDDSGKMSDALLKNLYRGDSSKQQAAEKMSEYLLQQKERLAACTISDMGKYFA